MKQEGDKREVSVVPALRRDLTKHQAQLGAEQQRGWNKRDVAELGKSESTARNIAKVSEAVCTAVLLSGLLLPQALAPDISAAENQALLLLFHWPQHCPVPLGAENF